MVPSSKSQANVAGMYLVFRLHFGILCTRYLFCLVFIWLETSIFLVSLHYKLFYGDAIPFFTIIIIIFLKNTKLLECVDDTARCVDAS